jgi:short-subunit dehydrogenase
MSVLVNNAGVGATDPLVASNVDKMEDMIRLNVTALTRLTYAACQHSSGAAAARSSTSRRPLPSAPSF